MIKNISVSIPQQSNINGEFNLVDSCPHCQNSIEPIIKTAHASTRAKKESEIKVAVLLLCPNNQCQQFFINWFSVDVNSYLNIRDTQRLEYYYKPILKNDLPKEVNLKFPEFHIIYSQAIQAESYGLDQIAGVGYRKALEFLIKQYCIHTFPEKEENIKKETLNNTIMNRLDTFPKLQKLAQAATWIGNDETHFVRKHEDKDITSMKKFIKSAATFISADLDADDALEFTEQN